MTSKSDAERVVVTGLGVVSGCGIGANDFFQSCLDGTSSIGKVQRFNADHYPCQIASEVPDDMFVAADHFDNKRNAKTNDRFTHFAVAAARLALKDGGMGDTPDTMENADRVGVMVGSAFGGMETFEQETLKLAKKPERPKVGRDGSTRQEAPPAMSCWIFATLSLTLSTCCRFHPLRSPPCWETLLRG